MMVPTVWTITMMMKNMFHQNKKLIAIHNRKKEIETERPGIPQSMVEKLSTKLVQIGELILKTTQIATYMIGNQKY